MSGYGRFACYYDKLTENVDYGKIAARCHEPVSYTHLTLPTIA